jgi:hypothetical protein
MGEIGIDKWFWRMEEHQQKGHQVIKYDTGIKAEVAKALILKNQRVNFWEENQRIPTYDELDSLGVEA